MGDFIPLFSVRFHHNYLGQNEHIKLYVIREIVNAGSGRRLVVLGHFCGAPRLYARLGSPKITILQFIT